MSENVLFSPTWTADGIFPQLGDGDLTGTCNLDQMWALISLRVGDATTYGTGAWLFGDPLRNPMLGGTGLARQAATRTHWTLTVARRRDGIIACTSDGRAVSAIHPFRWKAGDSLRIMLGQPPEHAA
jgi:hypothetical protein